MIVDGSVQYLPGASWWQAMLGELTQELGARMNCRLGLAFPRDPRSILPALLWVEVCRHAPADQRGEPSARL